MYLILVTYHHSKISECHKHVVIGPCGYGSNFISVFFFQTHFTNRYRGRIGPTMCWAYFGTFWGPFRSGLWRHNSRYRNSHTKIEDSKIHILRCMGSKFCVKFQRCPLKFHTYNFEPIHRKICISQGVQNLTTYDISELWHFSSLLFPTVYNLLNTYPEPRLSGEDPPEEASAGTDCIAALISARLVIFDMAWAYSGAAVMAVLLRQSCLDRTPEIYIILCWYCCWYPTSVFGQAAQLAMMTSSNGNILRVTGHLCREFTGHWWIPLTKANDAELWCFLWSALE